MPLFLLVLSISINDDGYDKSNNDDMEVFIAEFTLMLHSYRCILYYTVLALNMNPRDSSDKVFMYYVI